MGTYADKLRQRMNPGRGPIPRRKLNEQEEKDLLEEVLERTQEAWQHEVDNRREAALDLRFLAGDQWPMSVRADRIAANRPIPTINILPQFVRQVTNDIRQADLAVKVAPVDGKSDPSLAMIYNGILKQIHYRSSAKAVYASGSEHQASCGIGWWRITHDYVEDDAFDQELRVEKVVNPLSVYVDPAAVRADRADAKWAILTEMVPRKTFEKRWPNAKTDSVPVSRDTNTEGFFWITPDDVRVAEYYRKVPVIRTIAMLQDGEIVDITGKDDSEISHLAIQQRREVASHRIEHFLVSGAAVLEGPNDLPGKYIPLVPVVGSEIPLEKLTYRHGIIRFARDPQQLLNYYRAAATEAIALAPKAPYLVTAEQIGPYKNQWDTMNTTQRPYLLYKPDAKVPTGKPNREAMSEVPQALIQQAGIATDDVKQVTGIYNASLGQQGNEVSGIAIRSRQTEGDIANYHYADNFRMSLEHTGRILIDLIPHIYDNERIIKIVGDDDQEQFVPINHVLMGVDGIPVMVNDLSQASFDVRVSIGPSYTSRRQEATASLTEFVKSLPPNLQAISVDLIAKYSDWPGAEQLSKRFKNTIPPAVLVDPDDPNAPKPPDPSQNPQAIAQMKLLEGKIAELAAKVEETKAKAIDARADAILKLVQANVAHGESQQITEPPIGPAPQPFAMPGQHGHPATPVGPQANAPQGGPPQPNGAAAGGPAPPPGIEKIPPAVLQAAVAARARQLQGTAPSGQGQPPQAPNGAPGPAQAHAMPPMPQLPPRRPSAPPPGFMGGSMRMQ